MPMRDPIPRRTLAYEDPGTVDGAFDEDRRAAANVPRSDAACAIPWRADGFEAIQVFVDPALVDRAPEICASLTSLSATNRSLDDLAREVMGYATGAGLSAAIHEDPPDDLSVGVLAIAFTLG